MEHIYLITKQTYVVMTHFCRELRFAERPVGRYYRPFYSGIDSTFTTCIQQGYFLLLNPSLY